MNTPADAYRVFFPLGVAMGVAGVSIWPLFYFGITEGYSGHAHAFVQTNCFLYSFIVGFLWTAIPRFTGTPAPGPRLQYSLALLLVAQLVAFELYAFAMGHVLFLISHVFFLLILGGRFIRRRQPPPETFILVGMGLVSGLIAAVINAASALAWISPALDLLGKRLMTEGMVLLLVLGVGGFLGPRLLGFAQLPDLHRLEKIPAQRPVLRLSHTRMRINAVCGAILLAALLMEYGAIDPPGALAWLRALMATAIVGLNVQPWRLPVVRTTLAWCVWAAHWFLLAGVWLTAIFPGYRIDLLHVLFMGAFTLLIFAVGTRVVLSHGAHALAEERRSWPLRIGIAASVVGMSARLSVLIASSLDSYYAHLGWAGILWIVGMCLWGTYAVRRIRQSKRTEA